MFIQFIYYSFQDILESPLVHYTTRHGLPNFTRSKRLKLFFLKSDVSFYTNFVSEMDQTGSLLRQLELLFALNVLLCSKGPWIESKHS